MQREGAAGREQMQGSKAQRPERSAQKEGQPREEKAGEARGGHEANQKAGRSQSGQEAQKEREPNARQSAKTSSGSAGREQNGEAAGRNREPNSSQRASNIGGAARSQELGREGSKTGASRANFHIEGAQKTELHETILHDTAIRRYHRGDINFPVRVGTRIPASIEFFTPPARFVEIDPEFRRYKIVVLDDEILVVDPETREIVDIITA